MIRSRYGKAIGMLTLLIVVILITAALSDRFFVAANIENLIRRTALFGLIGIGAAFAIITGGIDLSIGSVVCMSGILLPWLITVQGWPTLASLGAVIGISLMIGLLHGVLITRLKLQPFIVTLCGLLLYRGIARGLTGDQTQGFGLGFESLRRLATAKLSTGVIDLPVPFLLLLCAAAAGGFILKFTVYGRYLLATGRNEQAARFSGIRTARIVTTAYMICSLLAGLGGILFILDVNSAQPSDFGNFYELYAIAGAVLGGCSLRGGEGTMVGVIIGTAIMQVLRNAIVLLDIPTQLEFAIIGGVILCGAIADVMVRKLSAFAPSELRRDESA